MTHRDAWPLLDAFLDGSLAASQRWAVAAHLEECAVCRKHLASQARLRGLVRENLVATEPPPGLDSRLRTALAVEASAAPVALDTRRPPAIAVRIAALLGPALVALWLLAQVIVPATVSASDVPAELAAAHALFARDDSLLDVAGEAPAVTAWFRDKVGLQISAPELEGYELVGGRLTVLGGKPVAQLVYETEPGERYLSLLRFKGPTPAFMAEVSATGQIALQKGTIATCIWPNGDEMTALVAEEPVADLQRLAADLLTPPGDGQDRDY